MTSAPAAAPLTVRSFLLGRDDSGTAPALRQALHDQHAGAGLLPGPRALTSAGDRAVEAELASVIGALLELDLVSLLAAGWVRHTALREAAHRTRQYPGSEEVVALATHSITSTHRPAVDVLVDGVPATTVEVGLTVVLRITGLVAVVRDAQLVAVRAGECEAEAKLAVREIPVASRQGRLDLPAELPLRSPVDLLPPDRQGHTRPSWQPAGPGPGPGPVNPG
ncbi:hypothetical protein [Streptomyces antimicrobicus]|uniref:Uncharacterized protein n=1 Tax=Streptomyces antimicrobicus TaxID=2883108 RepID=A0ABS8B059_9ACTN|nr:hypothetical protein [Streptomyces antimicrobicus]MCB5177986.1 hypothetical protein [Streptomyces antimicrobicus]